MNKTKVFFTATIIVSLVGSAFAFKAHRGNGTLACRTLAGICPATKDYQPDPSGTTMFCGVPGSADCNTKTEKVINVGQ